MLFEKLMHHSLYGRRIRSFLLFLFCNCLLYHRLNSVPVLRLGSLPVLRFGLLLYLRLDLLLSLLFSLPHLIRNHLLYVILIKGFRCNFLNPVLLTSF